MKVTNVMEKQLELLLETVDDIEALLNRGDIGRSLEFVAMLQAMLKISIEIERHKAEIGGYFTKQ